jgi:hypothetical protein
VHDPNLSVFQPINVTSDLLKDTVENGGGHFAPSCTFDSTVRRFDSEAMDIDRLSLMR